MAPKESSDDFLKRLSTPHDGTDAHDAKVAQFHRVLNKKHYHTCINCGALKKGGRCGACTGKPAKRKEAAMAARVGVFQFSPDALNYRGQRVAYPL